MSRSHLNLEQRLQKQRDDLAAYVEEQRAQPVTVRGKPQSRSQKRRRQRAKLAEDMAAGGGQ
jgi:hypothetical protein